MAHMILVPAQGAVGSLLGRLSSALAEEAQQLGRVRGDVQFIKDEMESMNGFLLHVAEAAGDSEHEDHQVRAWMKQVGEVAYASQNCVDLYVQSLGGARGRGQGHLAYLRRLPRLLWTLRARHRIAMQIRELKVRAREVGERRLRYGVEAPPGRGYDGSNLKVPFGAAGDDSAKDQEDAQRRHLVQAKPDPYESSSLVKWLTAIEGHHQPAVIAIQGAPEARNQFAETAFQDPWVADHCHLDCKAWIRTGSEYPSGRSVLLRNVLAKLDPPVHQLDRMEEWGDEHLVEKLQLHLKGKKFLIVLSDVWDTSLWGSIRSAFLDSNCSTGSAIIVTTTFSEVADSFSPYKIYKVDNLDSDRHDHLINFYFNTAINLVVSSHHQAHVLQPILWTIVRKLAKDSECISLFLHALYLNPNRTQEEFQRLSENLGKYYQKQLLIFLYNGLPINCKNCLLHLSIFPEKTTFRRTRLVRRWAAEGMVTKRGRQSALDEADRCFDVLVAHRLLVPQETSVTDKVKTSVMHNSIHETVAEIAREENFVKNNLPSDLTYRLPIRNAFQQQKGVQQLHTTHSTACWNFCNHFNRSYQAENDESNATKIFLESLSSSAQLGFLEVLDLEDCKEVKDNHLKNICNHVFQLKYLGLRNTEITKLPKQIDKLRYLETLDIRQTKVQAFAKNSGVLPKLKHLLAGHKTDYINQDGNQSEEPFHTVHMPKFIGAMIELQVLSHVKVSGRGDELVDIGNLLQLRKLGVVLTECQEQIFRHLYHAIEKLSKCLLSLSIQKISDKNADMDMSHITHQLLIPPKYLQTLEISGLIGLPKWIEKLGELSKITLHKTHLAVDDIETLGKLTRLTCLRLGQNSCSETVTFKKNRFQQVTFLVIECSDITNVNFVVEATPRLKKMVWRSAGSESLSLLGIKHLQNLKELRLTGNFNLERVQQEIAENDNNPTLKWKLK